MKLHYYADPGHGWLKVPRKHLIDLNIGDKITSFSFQRGNFVYLEEDCDASTYLSAMKDANKEFELVHHDSGKMSRIRNYERYAS